VGRAAHGAPQLVHVRPLAPVADHRARRDSALRARAGVATRALRRRARRPADPRQQSHSLVRSDPAAERRERRLAARRNGRPRRRGADSPAAAARVGPTARLDSPRMASRARMGSDRRRRDRLSGRAARAGRRALPRLMRVAVLTTSYPRFPGDVVGRFVADAVDHVRARGVDVEVVGPEQFRGYGLTYGHAVVGTMRGRPGPALAFPALPASLGRAARRVDADLLHAHWLPSGWVAARTGKPYVVQVWGTDVELARRAPRPART